MTEHGDQLHDDDAERAVLGGMILSRDVVPDVCEILDGPEFYTPAHETIYRTILALAAQGRPVDPITLTTELRAAGDLDRVGGVAALHDLPNAAPSAANATYYAEIVRDTAARRRLATAAARIGHLARSGEGDLDDVLALAAEEFTTAATTTAGRSAGGWEFADLGPVLDGTHKPIVATVGARDDGVAMFYPGRVNGLTGESEAGKTWAVLIASLVEMNRGSHVVYLDFEDSEDSVVGRLLLIGADPYTIRQQFHYVRPTAAVSPAGLRPFLDRVGELQPSLAVVDGVTEAMALLGWELTDNTEVAKFGRALLRPLAETGAAVVPLDHVVKSSEHRGRYALGGVHKLNAVDGVQYMLEAVRPFGLDVEGRSRLRVAKDRPGHVRRHSLPGKGLHWFADLVIAPQGDGFAEAHLYPPIVRDNDDDQDDGQDRTAREETELREREQRVLDVLAASPAPLSRTALADLVPGRASVTRRAITRLVHAGRVDVSRGPRNAELHSVAKGAAR